MNSNTADSLKRIASLLGIDNKELTSLLNEEFKAISADPFESKRHPADKDEFIEHAVERIARFAKDKDYLTVLKKIIRRDETRKFYFYRNELEAVSRILFVIENPNNFALDLDNLELHTLPILLRRTRNLRVLSVNKNYLQEIYLIDYLQDLDTLMAANNQITDIEFLKGNNRLKRLNLSGNNIKSTFHVLKTMPALREVGLAANRINDSLVIPILEHPGIERIVLTDNPINAPLEILNDIGKLRQHFGISIFPNDEKISKINKALKGEEIIKESNASKANDVPSSSGSGTYSSFGEDLDAFINEQLKESPDVSNFKITNAEETSPEATEPIPQQNTTSPPSKTVTEPSEVYYVSYPIRDIKLRGNPEKTLLDVENLSSIFYNLIANSDSNGEHFFGLFGRWGRGKTFFWKYILKNNLDTGKYIPIEFHAWKYQDTPGIWAYLYNTLNDAYLGDKPKWYQLAKWLTYYKKLLKLNEKRGKLSLLVTFGFSLIVAVGVYLYNDLVKGSDTLKTILGVGIPIGVVSMGIYIIKTFKTDARKIILSLTSNVNFNSQLGFQHEIQQELKYLLQAWIPEKQKFKKRIFLFIDDIDRCSEDKIIQIVDYIRVLLHCETIQERITVLAAIDERILLHAIQDKYKAFIENKDNDATYKELCREYMDKLFLAGLKLGPLTEFEKRQIVEGFTGMDTAIAALSTSQASNGISSARVADIISHTSNEEQGAINRETVSQPGGTKVEIPESGEPAYKDSRLAEPETDTIPVEPEPIASTAQQEFPYEQWEQAFIKDILARNTESTPRSIRVYTYRYLLGKQLVEKALQKGKTSWSQWYQTKEAKQCFAIKLLHYGFKSDTEHLLADYRNFISDYDESRSVKESIYGYEISLNQELGSIMFQVLTMIIAY